MKFRPGKPHLMFSLLAFASLGGLSTVSSAQQIYKWQDAKGAIHYTQTPPPVGAKSQMVEVRSRSNLQPASNPASNNAADTGAAKPLASQQVEAPQKQRLKPEDCQLLRSSLDTLNSGRRLYETDDKGERAYLTEEQRAERTSRYSKNLAEGCS